jgi:hypothetical protein
MGPCEMILVNWSIFLRSKNGNSGIPSRFPWFIRVYPITYKGHVPPFFGWPGVPADVIETLSQGRDCKELFGGGVPWGQPCWAQIHQNQSGYTWELMVTFGDGLSWCLFFWCFMGTCCFSGRIDENVGEAPSYLQSLPISRCRLSPTELAPQNDCVTFETSVGWHLGIYIIGLFFLVFHGSH